MFLAVQHYSLYIQFYLLCLEVLNADNSALVDEVVTKIQALKSVKGSPRWAAPHCTALISDERRDLSPDSRRINKRTVHYIRNVLLWF